MVKVLYILGSGRNGSTLLSRLLGEVPGFFAGGEIRSIWTRLIDHHDCGCGKPFDQCEFWRPVVAKAFAPGLDPVQVRRISKSLDRIRRLPHLLLGHPPQLPEFRSLVGSLYRAIADESGCEVIVDSSKTLGHLAIMQEIDGIEVIPVHLIRDPRGVAHSWAGKKARTDRRGEHYMRQQAHLTTAGMFYTNLLSELIPRNRVLRVRYEDLVSNPKREVLRIVETCMSSANVDFIRDNTVTLGIVHSVAGNPDRMNTGPVELELDERWRRDLDSKHRRLVTLVTAPLLRRYGYALGCQD